MSFYNMVNGVNPATFMILPMLGKHPDEYPRFRDCYTSHEDHPEYDGHIHVFTRTGGGNREEYENENNQLTEMPGYVTDYDDDYDSTYATFVFSVPEQWKNDFQKLMDGNTSLVSDEYKAEIKRVYPKLTAEIDKIFGEKTPQTME